MSHHVFVIDDEPAMVRLTCLILQTEGLEATAFSSPLQALKTLLDSSIPSPIALILDLNMPELDGREFYRRSRAGGYSGPVVILSAFGARAAQLELGAEAAVAKPFVLEVLVAELKRVLSSLPESA